MVDEPTPQQPKFSPRNFLRARRPERFSDSVAAERSVLDRTTLEYHLDTLTSRNQETLFEDFARKLAQLEVCPNLIPHTGPAGGGDSKVDSETYPVASAISNTWFIGEAGQSGSERWAFAMSAASDWRKKLQRDIKSLVGTDRGYAKAFYLSNQFIPDKKRATAEDELRTEHGLDVRIFDRTWILDRVFQGRHEDLAISSLSITVPSVIEVRKGPLDTQRERDLEEIEARIRASAQGPPTLGLVGDCLEAALLARNLEKPRTDIDGRFARAQRIATERGTLHQQVLALYEQAWTAFFWHEDLREFVRLYQEVQDRALSSDNISDVELVHNLWNLLISAARQADLPSDVANVEQRTEALKTALNRLRAQENRASVALQARSLLAMTDLALAIPEIDEKPLEALRTIVDEAEGLIGFPLIHLTRLITEISEFFVGNAAFEQLFEALVEATGKRRGEVASARMLLKRGAQQLDADQPYEAIRTLGRVLLSLYKHESREDLVRALALCAGAYERVGLLWAARGTLINASAVAANEWWTHSEVTLAQFRCSRHLKWIELQLGRVPHLLAWHELERATRHFLVSEGYSKDRLAIGERDFDGSLAILMLRSDIWQLKKMETLPDVLQKQGLAMAGFALTFALGLTDDIHHEDAIVTEKDQIDLFTRLASQPVAKDLPKTPLLQSERHLHFASVVLGAVIEVTTDNRSPCVELAESLLAAVEGLLATSVLEGIAPRVGVLSVRIRHSDFAEFPFAFEMTEEAGLPVLNVRCPFFNAHEFGLDRQTALKDKLVEVTAGLLSRGFYIDSESTLRRILGEERGLQRAIQFTGSFVTLANSLGSKPKTAIEDWATPAEPRYALTRTEEWDATERRRSLAAKLATPRLSELPRNEELPPDDFPDLTGVKHSDITFESLIREALWDKARWRGVGVAVAPGMPPWLVLGFENGAAAAEILTHLVRDIGNDDPENRLRITIVKGISKKNPFHYRVVIGSNIDKDELKKFSNMMFRVHTMEPASSRNLDMFAAAFAKEGAFLLGIGTVNPKSLQPPEPMRHGYVLKRHIQIRHAWEIGLNDIDGAGVTPDDDVMIPAGRETDAPVLKALEWKRERIKESGWIDVRKTTRDAPRHKPSVGKIARRKKQKLKKQSRKRNRH